MRKKKIRVRPNTRYRGKTGQTMEDMVMSALANSQYREEVDNYFAAPLRQQPQEAVPSSLVKQQQEAEPWLFTRQEADPELFGHEEEHDSCGTPDCCNSCDDDEEGLNWESLVPLPTKKLGN